MKKLIALLMAATMLLSMAACGNAGTNDDVTNNDDTTINSDTQSNAETPVDTKFTLTYPASMTAQGYDCLLYTSPSPRD